MKIRILVYFVVISLFLTVVGCTQTSTPSVSQPVNTNVTGNITAVENQPTTKTPIPQVSKEDSPISVKIIDILDKPDVYKGQEVIVKGKILSECGSGCWFTLNDSSGTIYIDLAPSNLVIPQKRGAIATVHAKVVQEKGDTYLIGTKVEF